MKTQVLTDRLLNKYLLASCSNPNTVLLAWLIEADSDDEAPDLGDWMTWGHPKALGAERIKEGVGMLDDALWMG